MKFFIHLIYILFFSLQSYSQNIYDISHSDKYAQHLYNTDDFKNAVIEYERLIKMAPDSLKYKYKLLSAYKLSGKINEGIEKTKVLFGSDYLSYPEEIIKNFIELLIVNENYEYVDSILFQDIKLKQTLNDEYQLALNILRKDFQNMDTLLLDKENVSKRYQSLIKIYEDAENTDFKQPALAAVLSILIPGAGKAYSNDFYNAALVFSMISLYSIQAYRAFKINGYSSVYGWGFGIIAGSFYISNIYGSFRSANRENDSMYRLLKKDVLQTLINSN